MSIDSCHTVVRSKGSTEENAVAVKAEKRQYADDKDSKMNPLYKTDAFRIERFKVSTSPLCCQWDGLSGDPASTTYLLR